MSMTWAGRGWAGCWAWWWGAGSRRWRSGAGGCWRGGWFGGWSGGGGVLGVPAGGGTWRLGLGGGRGGVLDDLRLVECPEAARPLGAGQVRVAVRAAGVNFRDVLLALGMYSGAGEIGPEGAGVVTEAGPGVTGWRRGTR